MNKYNADLRVLVEQNNNGVVFTYKGHKYKIITGIMIQDLATKEYLMLGVDF